MSIRLKIILGILVILLISCKDVVKQETVKIGIIAPLSDWGAYWGIPFINGAEIAKEDVNNNQVKLEIIPEDSKGNGKDAITAVQKLINVDEITAAIVEFAPPTLAVSPLLKEAEIPFIYDAFVKSPLLANEYAFKSFIDVAEGCRQLVTYAKERGIYKNLGAILAQVEYNQICLEAIKDIEPDLKVYWYSFGETDFKTLLLKAKDANTDTILILGWANEFLPFFQQKTELGYNFNILCGSGSECLNEEVAKSIPKEELEGTLTFDYSDLTNTNFASKYKEKFPRANIAELIAAAHGYEAVVLLSEAWKQCSKVTSACIKENLNSVKDYHSALKSNGFKNRVLQIDTSLYQFRDGKLIKIV